jgi:signal transduction histidine kinase
VTEANDADRLSPDERAYFDTIALFLTYWRGALIGAAVVTLIVASVWNDYLSSQTRLVWSSVAMGNYLVQAYVSWKLESGRSLVETAPRYMPWLLASIAVSGMVWGSVPWLISPPSTPVLAYTSLFNLMLIYSIANSPATLQMLFCAVIPVMVLNASAIVVHDEAIHAGYYLVMALLVLFYGLRLQKTIRNSMTERHTIKDLHEQLERHQQQLLAVERDNALLTERQRLMYDMHDGLGSTLISTLTAIEHDQLPQQAVVEALRGCIVDLRLVIDSLEPIDHNIVMLLAIIRYRMGQHLQTSGLTLEWDVQDLPPLPWLEPPDALHVLRVVQEALANVLKHANADQVRVVTRDLGQQVEIRVEDNGRGFEETEVEPGHGLLSQRRRAEQLGGELIINSTPGHGSSLSLRLPVNR